MAQSGENGYAKRTMMELLLMVAIASLLLLFWVLFVRSGQLDGPIDTESIWELSVEPYQLGLAIQELLGPIILLLLFSRTKLFQRVVSGQSLSSDKGKLIGVLVAIQLVYMAIQAGMIESVDAQISSGLFVVVVAGLLGGWQAGLVVGAVTTLSLGFIDYAVWGEPERLSLYNYLSWHVFQSISSMAAIWLGFVAGVVGEYAPINRRFAPARLLIIGLVGEIIIAIAVFFSYPESFFFIER